MASNWSREVPSISYSWLWHFEQDDGKDYDTTDKPRNSCRTKSLRGNDESEFQRSLIGNDVSILEFWDCLLGGWIVVISTIMVVETRKGMSF